MNINKMLEHILIDKINDDTKVVLIIEENESVDIVMQNINGYKELDEIMCEAFNRYMNKINIVNVDYDIEVINEADDYMVKNNLQAYCDYNETKITISRKYIDGTIKTHRILIIDLLHEILHAYFYETGTTELNNELAIECVSMMMINQNFLKKAKDIIELI